MKKLLCAALVLVAAACGGQQADSEFLNATPDVDGLMAQITGDSSEGVSSTSSKLSSQGDLGQAQSAELMGASEYLLGARAAVAGLNAIVRAAITPIVDLIKSDPTMANGDVHVWGPTDRGNATYQFTMRKAAAKKYGWKLEGKPIGAADDQYRIVLAGGIKLFGNPHRGQGVLTIDGDAFAAIDPDIHSQGKLFVAYRHGTKDARALVYGLKDFSPDTTQHQPLSAVLEAVRGPLGRTAVRMATYSDISDPANGTKELVLSRVRWMPLVGGRADGIVTLGDVPAGHYFLINSCWNAQLQEGFKRVRDCLDGQAVKDCTEVKVVGDEAACAKELPEKLPSKELDAADKDDDKNDKTIVDTEQLDTDALPGAISTGNGADF